MSSEPYDMSDYENHPEELEEDMDQLQGTEEDMEHLQEKHYAELVVQDPKDFFSKENRIRIMAKNTQYWGW